VSVVTGEGEAAADAAVLGTMPLPGIPVSAGAMIFDRAGRLLILKPVYKSGWTIPGGVMEADGETPWEACRREVREETGLDVTRGRLAAMDFRRPRPGRPGGIRFLFDCGKLSDRALDGLLLQPEEVSEWRLASLPDALGLLRGPGWAGQPDLLPDDQAERVARRVAVDPPGHGLAVRAWPGRDVFAGRCGARGYHPVVG